MKDTKIKELETELVASKERIKNYDNNHAYMELELKFQEKIVHFETVKRLLKQKQIDLIDELDTEKQKVKDIEEKQHNN